MNTAEKIRELEKTIEELLNDFSKETKLDVFGMRVNVAPEDYCVQLFLTVEHHG